MKKKIIKLIDKFIKCLNKVKKTSTSKHHISPKETKNKINVFRLSIILFVIILIIGTIGYRYLFTLNWLYAFYNATLILTAIGVEDKSKTNVQKIFVALYYLVAVIIFISLASRAVSDIADIFERKMKPYHLSLIFFIR